MQPEQSADAAAEELLRSVRQTSRKGRLWIGSLVAVCSFGLFAYAIQLIHGLEVTAMREYVSWGLYIATFIFFIGISHAGTLISAILRVTHAEWRRPITRMAEAITVIALLVGAPMVIVDMGRPDRLLYVIRYGRLQSPILWDVLSIATYLTGSLLYLYVALIPDLARMRDQCTAIAGWRKRLYRILAIRWHDTPAQRAHLEKALGAMAVIIIPVAVSVHTVVSWVFGMTLRPGWHSTIFGPYFVVGAIFSGTAAIITAMAVFRRVYHLERYIALQQFRNLGSLLLTLSLLYMYFTLSEYLTSWYSAESIDVKLLKNLFDLHRYGFDFWVMAMLGLFIPTILLILPKTRTIIGITTASVLVNLGMWLKRYLIVVPTLQTPFLPVQGVPSSWIRYFPTWIEWSIVAGALAMFLLLFTLFSKLFPIVSIWETLEDTSDVPTT
ncbi:MAG: polysulfide reductase NrfD [Candidatus Omnitrophica bacterium]|nr:polysulfide reductase NrfD [Candidatus Omnitrophota bacterium]